MSLQLSRQSSGGTAVQSAVSCHVAADECLSPDVAEWIRTYSFAAYDRKRRGKEMLGVLGTNHQSAGEVAEWCELVECEFRIQATRTLSPLVLNSLRKKVEVIQSAGPRRITGLFRTSVNDSFVVSKSDLAVLEELLPGCRRILLSKPHEDGSLTIRVFHPDDKELWVRSTELEFPRTAVAQFGSGERALSTLLSVKSAAARIPSGVKIFVASGILGAIAGLGVSYFESQGNSPFDPVRVPAKEELQTPAGGSGSPAKGSNRENPPVANPATPAPNLTNPQNHEQRGSLPLPPGAKPDAKEEAASTFMEPPFVPAAVTRRVNEEEITAPPDLEPAKRAALEIPIGRFEPPRTPTVPAANSAPIRSPATRAEIRSPEPNSLPETVDTYIPPRPLSKAAPSTRPFGERLVYGATEVKIQVSIDAAGVVRNARLAGAVSKPNEMLAKQALQAAREWTFIPATRGGKPVTSEYTIQFRFR